MSTTETLSEAVRFLFEDEGRDPGPSSIEDEFRRSASVLATFDPARLVTKAGVGPPDADVMQRILRDCEVRRISSGLPRWHLKPDARVRALQTFETRDDLRDTLLANERAESDPIQQAIDGAVLEHRINSESQSPIQLTAALQVVNWFQNVPKEDPLQLPRAEEIQVSSELLELKSAIDPVSWTAFCWASERTTAAYRICDASRCCSNLRRVGSGRNWQVRIVSEILARRDPRDQWGKCIGCLYRF